MQCGVVSDLGSAAVQSPLVDERFGEGMGVGGSRDAGLWCVHVLGVVAEYASRVLPVEADKWRWRLVMMVLLVRVPIYRSCYVM